MFIAVASLALAVALTYAFQQNKSSSQSHHPSTSNLGDATKPTFEPNLDLTHVSSDARNTLTNLQQAVRTDPSNALAWGRLGFALREYRLPVPALQCFAEAERLDPLNPRWPYFSGALSTTESPTNAEPKLRRAAELAGINPPAPRLAWVRWLSEQARWPEASAQLKPLLESASPPPHALLLAAQEAASQSRVDEAIDWASKAANHSSSSRPAWALLATLHRRKGDSSAADIATKHLSTATGSDRFPEDFDSEFSGLRRDALALSERVHPLLAAARLSEAAQWIAEMHAQFPEFPDTWLASGRLAFLQRDLAKALTHFEKHLALDPSSIQGWFQLGLTHLQLNRITEAEHSFSKALELKPDFGPAWFNLGVVRGRQNRFPEAELALKKTIELNPEYLDSYLLLADISARAKNKSQALSYLSAAEKISPSHPRIEALRAKISAARP